MEAARKKVVEALSTPYLDNLYRAFDVLMHDPGVKDNPNRPNMAELWAQPEDARRSRTTSTTSSRRCVSAIRWW